MKVVFTGSSMLQIEKGEGDLSRRVAMYTMHGMSFREYLSFEGILGHPAISLEELLKNHISIASDIVENIRIIPHFKEYCKYGYYPFYKEDKEGFHARLNEVCRQVIESDIPSVEKVEYITVQKLKKLLMITALQVPFVPKMDDLYAQLETSREQGLKLLELLQRGALLGLLKTKIKSVKRWLHLRRCSLTIRILCMPSIGIRRSARSERPSFTIRSAERQKYTILRPETSR